MTTAAEEALKEEAKHTDMDSLADEVLGGGDEGGEEQKPVVKPEAKTEESPTPAEEEKSGSENLPPEDLNEEQPANSPEAIKQRVEAEFPEPQGLGQKSSEAFRAMRQKIVESETKLELAQKGAISSEELQAMRQKLSEYESSRTVRDIVNSQEFTQKYTEPRKQTISEISRVGQRYKLPQHVLEQAARMTDSAERAELLAGERIPMAGLSVLNPLFDKLVQQTVDLNTAMKKAKEDAAQKSAEFGQQREQKLTSALDGAVKRLQEKNHFLLRDSSKNPNWMPGLKASAKKVLSGAVTTDELAEQAVLATLSEHYRAMAVARGKRVLELEKKLGLRQAHSPKAGAVSPSSGSARKSSVSKAQSFEDLAAEIA